MTQAHAHTRTQCDWVRRLLTRASSHTRRFEHIAEVHRLVRPHPRRDGREISLGRHRLSSGLSVGGDIGARDILAIKSVGQLWHAVFVAGRTSGSYSIAVVHHRCSRIVTHMARSYRSLTIKCTSSPRAPRSSRTSRRSPATCHPSPGEPSEKYVQQLTQGGGYKEHITSQSGQAWMRTSAHPSSHW